MARLILMARRAALVNLTRRFDIWFVGPVHKYRCLLGDVLAASLFKSRHIVGSLLHERSRLISVHTGENSGWRFITLAFVAVALALVADIGNSETSERYPGNTSRSKGVRTQRPRIPEAFFKQQPVRFDSVHVDANGKIRADGHDLQLYGATLVPRNRICASTEGARWTCGQRAFMAMRGLLEARSITCKLDHVTVPPKAICQIGERDVAHFLLSAGWAELAPGVSDEVYVEAAESAQTQKLGIWGDAPP